MRRDESTTGAICPCHFIWNYAIIYTDKRQEREGKIMKQKIWNLAIETPEGVLMLEINQMIMYNADDVAGVILSAVIQGKKYSWEADTTEDALVSLDRSLPENWHIKSCLSCRFGHFCPIGDYDNELFCVTDFEPKSARDLWHVTEDDFERKKRSRSLFDYCNRYEKQSNEYFTYNDYFSKINDKTQGRIIP